MKWLILRGLVREQRHWGNFRKVFEDELKRTDPSAEVYCLDFPGFGTEASRFSPSTIAEIAADLRRRWQKLLKPGEEWGLLAISLGGMVAMQWCSDHPGDFKKLVLVNSSVKGLSPLHRRMKPQNYLKVISLLMNPDVSAREEKVLKMTSNLTGLQLTEKARHHLSFALPIRKRDAISQIIAAIRFRVPERLKLPILVLVSRGDRLVDPTCSEEIAKHFSAEIRHHPHANHDLATDDPEWIAKSVHAWLSA
jgi:pimeloyl-ACP methyl ester carboxylesterase